MDEATAHYRQALGQQPENADALKNLGVTLLDQGKLAEAEEVFRQMFAVQPDAAEAHLGLAGCYLVAGDFKRGWPEYEWRWRTPEFGTLPDLPRWQGQPLAGRSLLLVAEQGLGDTLQFIRYARPLKKLGASDRAHVSCEPAPAAGKRTGGRRIARVAEGDRPPCDYYLPLLSAPHALGTTELTIPREVPYLAADPQRLEAGAASWPASRV